MIKLESIDKSYGQRPVLRGFSLDIAQGERVCLKGVSGCGKTTVLRLIAGLVQPDAGTIELPDDVRFSVVFQENRLLPWKTALENVTVAGADTETALNVLERLGLSGEERKYPAQLSGGMQRRVAIARALANPGDVFLLDEPIQGLDDGTAGRVLDVMNKALEGYTVVLVSHDEDEISALARRVIELEPVSAAAPDA